MGMNWEQEVRFLELTVIRFQSHATNLDIIPLSLPKFLPLLKEKMALISSLGSLLMK